MQLSNVICDCDATSGIPGSGTVSCRQHNLSSYCLCSRRELDAACCCCLLPMLLLLRLMSLRLLLIGLSIANCACALWVCLLAPHPSQPSIGAGTGRCHHHQQHCRRWRFWGEIATARLGIVAENYYSGYYSQSITLPQRHSHTQIHKQATVRQRATFWQAQLSIHVLHIMTIIMAATIMNAWRLITPSRR